MRSVEANDPRSPSVQIADDLRDQITSGLLIPGVRLPSSRELARTYGVALMTAQTALQRLRQEEYVFSTGRGYFVSDPEQPHAAKADGLAKRIQAAENDIRELRARLERLESSR